MDSQLELLRDLITLAEGEAGAARLPVHDMRKWSDALCMTPFGYDGAKQLQIVRWAS